jgi:thymidylate synthase
MLNDYCICIIFALAHHALHHLISAHVYAYVIDHVELELEEPSEQAQAEDTNPEFSQGKTRCITTNNPCLLF